MKKTVLITGGSKGIGRGIAIQLAREGYSVAVNYHADDRSAEKTLAECREIAPDTILIKADVSDRADVEAMIGQCVETFGALDILINNAGLNIDKPLHEISESDWDRVVDTNMKGVFLCSQMASEHMLKRDEPGIILNVGASTGIRGRVNGANYCASKAGVIVLTKCLALELAPKIRVNCVIPGIIRTGEAEEKFRLNDPEGLKKTEATLPLGRVGVVEEMASTVSFLVSDGARYITGQKVIVDGGQFMY